MSTNSTIPVETPPIPDQPEPAVVVDLSAVTADRRRGGEVRVLLSPRSARSTSGFMGHVTVGPGESVAEHYHPYSEEFLFLVEGQLTVRVNGELRELRGGQAILIPPYNRHRLENHSDATAVAVFQLGPLAPRPDLGHVDTEDASPVAETPKVPEPEAGADHARQAFDQGQMRTLFWASYAGFPLPQAWFSPQTSKGVATAGAGLLGIWRGLLTRRRAAVQGGVQ